MPNYSSGQKSLEIKTGFVKTRFYLKLLLVFLLVTVFFYHGAFGANFFQDDWFSLSISKVKSLGELLSFFIPRSDLIYYRPLGIQLPFFVLQSVFGINPLPFRVLTVILHLVNGFLCYFLLYQFLKQKRLAVLGALLYIVSTVHMTVFYWASTLSFILAPAFYLSSVLFFLRRKEKLSLILFCLGLFANELLITLPVILTIFHFGSKLKKNSLTVGKFWLILVLYALIRLRFGSVLGQGQYELTLDIRTILVNVRDYLLWVFNWPEEIRSQFSSLFIPNFSMVKSFPFEWISLGILTLLHFLIVLYLLTQQTLRLRKRIVSFGLIWFAVSMVPVLFFSAHSFSYYLPIPLFGLLLSYMTLFRDLSTQRKSVLMVTILVAWLGTAWITVRFNTNHHWTVKRAILSGEMMRVMRKAHPTLPADAIVIVFDNGDKTSDQKWSWGDQYAMQIVYGSPAIFTFYSFTNDGNDLYKIIPETLARDRIYKLPCIKTLTCW